MILRVGGNQHAQLFFTLRAAGAGSGYSVAVPSKSGLFPMPVRLEKASQTAFGPALLAVYRPLHAMHEQLQPCPCCQGICPRKRRPCLTRSHHKQAQANAVSRARRLFCDQALIIDGSRETGSKTRKALCRSKQEGEDPDAGPDKERGVSGGKRRHFSLDKGCPSLDEPHGKQDLLQPRGNHEEHDQQEKRNDSSHARRMRLQTLLVPPVFLLQGMLDGQSPMSV